MRRRKDIPVALYRMFSASGELLYIGQSAVPHNRLSQHRFSSDWVTQTVKITVEWFANRDEAMRAEAEAIRAERPLHNVAGTNLKRSIATQKGGHVLKRWLEQNGVSIADFAERIGAKPKQVHRFISCEAWPIGRYQYEIERETDGQLPHQIWVRGGVVTSSVWGKPDPREDLARRLLIEVSQ